MKKAIILYLSYSGNTKEVADLIEATLVKNEYIVDTYRIGWSGAIPDLSIYDIIFIGTFTWGKGAVPKDMKDFIWELGYKPDNIVVFGTGDTQFGGDDLFCHATEKLRKFYCSKFEPLKVEQSPRGQQEIKVSDWTEGVISKWND
jgi:flavodoxin I